MKNLGFGLMRLPLQDTADQKSIDYESLNRMQDNLSYMEQFKALCESELEVFAIYNDFQRHGVRGGAMMRYMDLISVSGKPKDCIECKQCEKSCPQHLPITKHLKKVKEVVSFLE